MILVSRNRRLARCAAAPPSLLDANAHTDDSWASMIDNDLQWLFDHTDPEHRPGQHHTLDSTHDAICSDPRRFRAQVRSALQRYLRRQADQVHHDEWLRQLRPYQNNDDMPPLPNMPQPAPARSIMCYLCGATFYHESAYHVHMGKEHPDDAHPTQWASGTRCLTCSREYHDIARIIKHLYSTRSCADP